jgi:hypothetical protein
MGYPRNMTVDPHAPGFYHCISRCVRRAWLCGVDPLSGQNFDHRRGWIEQRLLDLAESFAVELYAWAVMSNHTHIVLRIDPGRPQTWSDEDVARRWTRLTRTLGSEARRPAHIRMRQLLEQPERLAEVRARLGSLSWFMRFMNECIARQANAEDRCTGRFWEGRFKCQALLDEPAVLTCMSYVDLNPIRAGMSEDLASSDFTSIQRRLRALERQPERGTTPLGPVTGERSEGSPGISLAAYIARLERTDRIARSDSPGMIGDAKSARFAAIRGSPDWWIACASRIEEVFGCAVGTPESLRAFARATGRCWLRGT